jgi:serine-type D-Ala-D-Ala carboxypeptidase/endopeptidase (penicillin-binding protein 4)
VVLLVAAGAVTYRLDLLHPPRADHPSATPPPARIPPPAGLTLPAPARSLPPVAAAASPLRADPSAVRRAVDRLAASRKLGPHVVVRVAQLADGRLLYQHGSGPVVPASTMKLLTMVAALATLGPDHRFTTSVVATPQSPRIVLVGGGDPLLARTPAGDGSYPQRADLDTLAASTAHALRALGRHTVRLGYDASLFAGSGVDRYWEPSYLPDDVVSPISALWVDEGRERTGLAARTRTPARAAAEVFARALERRHIKVRGAPAATVAPTAAHGGRPVARVRSAPLAEIVQHIVEVSDNEGAEVLAHQVAVAQGRPATFAGAAVAVRHALGKLAISTAGDRIYDGSGLSRDDRLRAATLLSVIRTASSERHPGLRSAVADLPVAGFTGSLAARFDTGNPLGLGRVRAKTGTLTGVHGLAGTVTTRDGVVLEFVAVADRVRPVNTLDARARLDELAAALAGCACRATP